MGDKKMDYNFYLLAGAAAFALITIIGLIGLVVKDAMKSRVIKKKNKAKIEPELGPSISQAQTIEAAAGPVGATAPASVQGNLAGTVTDSKKPAPGLKGLNELTGRKNRMGQVPIAESQKAAESAVPAFAGQPPSTETAKVSESVVNETAKTEPPPAQPSEKEKEANADSEEKIKIKVVQSLEDVREIIAKKEALKNEAKMQQSPEGAPLQAAAQTPAANAEIVEKPLEPAAKSPSPEAAKQSPAVAVQPSQENEKIAPPSKIQEPAPVKTEEADPIPPETSPTEPIELSQEIRELPHDFVELKGSMQELRTTLNRYRLKDKGGKRKNEIPA
jgi:hypothetical protein